MRIIIISDSHGRQSCILSVFDAEPSAEYAFFLGDGICEAKEAFALHSNKVTCKAVRGNCDFYSTLPYYDTITVKGVKIYMTHGHMEEVKFGLENLKLKARENGAQIALFGHTHEQFYKYEQGLHLFNPGSIQDGRYGVIDITKAGIIPISKRLHF